MKVFGLKINLIFISLDNIIIYLRQVHNIAFFVYLNEIKNPAVVNPALA